MKIAVEAIQAILSEKPYILNSKQLATEIFEKLTSVCDIRKRQSDKTLKQLGFYFGVLLPAFCNQHGYDNPDYVDYFLKEMFLKVPAKGKRGYYVKSKATLNISQMTEFIVNCTRVLIDHGGRLTADQARQFEDINNYICNKK